MSEYPKHLHKPWTFDAKGQRVLDFKVAYTKVQEDALLAHGYRPKAEGPAAPPLPPDAVPEVVDRLAFSGPADVPSLTVWERLRALLQKARS